MTAAWVIIGLLVLGLPLLAWWVGGRRVWGRLRPGAEPDPWRDAMREYRLTPQETATVESAVNWGRRLEDPRLRFAAVAWARAQLERKAALRSGRPTWLRRLVVALLVAALGAVTFWWVHEGADFPWWLLLYSLLSTVGSAWLESAPRRAVRLNSD